MPQINTATQSATDTMITYQGGVELMSRPALLALSCSIAVLVVAGLAVIGWRTLRQKSCHGRKLLAHPGKMEIMVS